MKKILALILCAAMIFACAACGNTAEPAADNTAVEETTETDAQPAEETPAEPEVVHIDRNEGMLPFEDGNLFKLTSADDFAAGEMEELEAAAVGDGAVKLADGALEGTFTSPEFYSANFSKMVACWNASIPEGTSVEIFARARKEAPDTEEVKWSDWLTWGEFSPYINRGTSQNKSGIGGYVDQDTFTSTSGYLDGFQMMAVIKRDSADIDSPVLREMTMTFKGGDMVPTYAEETVELPAQALCASPAYSQEIRWSAVADSICSPTTMTVLLNTINPELDLLPEEYALNSQDQGESIFGNWSFCCAFAGCYGYECYCQYGGKDIMLQELAKGHPVGLSVAYDPKTLTGAWGSTGGHLISIIGYEYEDGIMDDDHLCFFSSDSYSEKDCESYRRYKWTQMAKLDCSFVCYVIPSDVREEECVGVQRIMCQTAKGAEAGTLILTDEEGNQISLDNCRSGKGFVAYTVEGVATDMTADTYESDCSIVYPNAINVTANNTFTYIKADKDSAFPLDKKEALKAAGVKDGKITIYAVTNCGYVYIAEL